MSRRQLLCSCGEPVRTVLEQLNHCGTYEPIDDLDNPDIIKASD